MNEEALKEQKGTFETLKANWYLSNPGASGSKRLFEKRMKVVKVNKGRVVPPTARVVLSFLVVGSVWLSLKFVQPTYAIFLAMLVSLLLPAVWFSFYLIVVNLDKEEIFDGIWLMGRRFGRPERFSEVRDVLVKKVGTKPTIYTLSDNKQISTREEYRAYLSLKDGREYFMFSHPLEEEAVQKVKRIKQKLQLV